MAAMLGKMFSSLAKNIMRTRVSTMTHKVAAAAIHLALPPPSALAQAASRFCLIFLGAQRERSHVVTLLGVAPFSNTGGE